MSRPLCPCGQAQGVGPGGLCRRCIAAKLKESAMPAFPVKDLPLNAIRIDGSTQTRIRPDPSLVEVYAQAIAGTEDTPPAVFPPAVVFHDGVDHWLADGFHRVLAAGRANRLAFPCEVRPGTARDALLYACGANAAHGLKRSSEDLRNAVRILLVDPEWKSWSDREISRTCHCSPGVVGKYRAELAREGETQPDTHTARRKGKDVEYTAKPKRKTVTVRADSQEDEWEEPVTVRADSHEEPEIDLYAPPADSVKDKPLLDGTGQPVPSHLRDAFADPWLRRYADDLANLIGTLKAGKGPSGFRSRVQDHPYLPVANLTDLHKSMMEAGESLWEMLTANLPYAVCPSCGGKGCVECRKGGHVPQWRHNELSGGSEAA